LFNFYLNSSINRLIENDFIYADNIIIAEKNAVRSAKELPTLKMAVKKLA